MTFIMNNLEGKGKYDKKNTYQATVLSFTTYAAM